MLPASGRSNSKLGTRGQTTGASGSGNGFSAAYGNTAGNAANKAVKISLPLYYDMPSTVPRRRKFLRVIALVSVFGFTCIGSIATYRTTENGGESNVDSALKNFPAAQNVRVGIPAVRECLSTAIATYAGGGAVSSENIPIEGRYLESLQDIHDLVIVTGHAIYISPDYNPLSLAEEERWILEEYQKGNGHVETFLDHIRKGAEIAAENEQSMLVFAGGQTRPSAGFRSEAQSYWLLANAMSLLTPSLQPRTMTEEHSKDSHENLIFSIARFREITGRYPRSITVVGFEFKRLRFNTVHRKAVRWPEERFTYVGIDPPSAAGNSLLNGETVNSLTPFHSDFYGCRGSLREKKLKRNPFRHNSLGYVLTCPEISSLLLYCPADGISVYPDPLPWAS